MKSLHDKVNIVPVIAKADTLTKKEVKIMKERVKKIYIQFYHLFICWSSMFYFASFTNRLQAKLYPP